MDAFFLCGDGMTEDSYILSIDQGTTSTRALIFDQNGHVVRIAQKELTLITPQSGWVEQDAEHIWRDTVQVCRDVLDGFDAPIKGIGITNQRETTIVWDKKTGEPVYNAIVWQDRRTAERCQSLKDEGHETQLRVKTGLLLDPYFSGTKISWILDHCEGAREKANNGDLLFGTIDSFLMWRLSGGQTHVTDVTNASRTMLYNIVDGDWCHELCDLLGVPSNMLPIVQDSSSHFLTVDCDALDVLNGIRVGGVAGDQQAALFGQACFKKGMIKSTYGTGCFALMNIGETFKSSQNRLLTTIAWRLNGQVTYALEGSIFVAGAAIQFLRDNLGFFDDAKVSESLARSVTDTEGVYFVPSFTGLGAPHWQPNVRGALLGLSRGSTQAHITRAALEAQAYQSQDLCKAMIADTGVDVEVLRVDGGLVRNDFVCEAIADICDTRVQRPKNTEATAWGAAALAGLHVGVYNDLNALQNLWESEKEFQPKMTREEAGKLYARWEEAVQCVQRF